MSLGILPSSGCLMGIAEFRRFQGEEERFCCLDVIRLQLRQTVHHLRPILRQGTRWARGVVEDGSQQGGGVGSSRCAHPLTHPGGKLIDRLVSYIHCFCSFSDRQADSFLRER